MGKNVLVMVSPMSTRRLSGIARFAKEEGWQVLLQDRLGHHPLAWNGDGVIVTLRNDPSTCSHIAALIQRGIPVVDLTIQRPDIDVPRVVADHYAIGRLAAEHFLDRNFHHYAWFSLGWGHVHHLRYRGYASLIDADRWVAREALSKRKLHDWKTFSSWIKEKMAGAPKPLAILTYDEADSARLLSFANELGLSVPEEVAILSIGDERIICENQTTPLSSIDQNLEYAAYEAAKLLKRLMNGAPPPRKAKLIPPTGIVLRPSTDVMAVADPLVRQAITFIKANLASRFGVIQIAEALKTTTNILQKRFMKELGRPAGAEVARQRLAQAKLLLRNTSLTLAEIASATGYCTPSHLSNTFRRAIGVSPRRWRAEKKR
jgi:LacI family transcriptional regulator